MKKFLSLLLVSLFPFTGLAGTVSAAAGDAPEKPGIVMTVPSDYDYVYDRLTEVFGEYTGEAPVEEIIMEEPAAEEIIEETPAEDAVMEEAVVEEAAPQSGGSGEYSKTNVQVEGIDEGDIVKTDGEYIYVLKDVTADIERLIILEADGDSTRVISRSVDVDSGFTKKSDSYAGRLGHTADYTYEDVDETAREMYICGSHAAVVLDHRHRLRERTDGVTASSEELYTIVRIYDISDPASPVLENTVGQSGRYRTSRMIGGELILLTDFEIGLRTREERARYIPSLYRNGETACVPADTIVIPPEIGANHYTTAARYDTESGEITAVKSLLTHSDHYYINGKHLYLADEHAYTETSEPYTESVYTVTESLSGRCTDIYRLSLGENIVTTAFCTVDGSLLNQFAMDEYDGCLRVVTTHSTTHRTTYTDEAYGFVNTRRVYSGETNGLYIFDEQLNPLGSITGLAEDERVYSVRFTGEVGYFVTFRETDPLFAADLSDPSAPGIMSALKIPGFSEYLHPYADGLLFGLGQNAAPDGWVTGMKLSMFDVSDPFDVTECHKIALPFDRSAASSNHRAILIVPDRGLIGFPTEEGYALYRYDETAGFTEITRIPLDHSYLKNSKIRGLYIGDMFYLVTQNCTFVLDMNTFELAETVNY